MPTKMAHLITLKSCEISVVMIRNLPSIQNYVYSKVVIDSDENGNNKNSKDKLVNVVI